MAPACSRDQIQSPWRHLREPPDLPTPHTWALSSSSKVLRALPSPLLALPGAPFPCLPFLSLSLAEPFPPSGLREGCPQAGGAPAGPQPWAGWGQGVVAQQELPPARPGSTARSSKARRRPSPALGTVNDHREEKVRAGADLPPAVPVPSERSPEATCSARSLSLSGSVPRP